MDFNSLYPGSILPVAQRAMAKTIGANLVPVKPMSAPSGMMPYMDWGFVPPWIDEYEHIPGAIRVKIKDTFDNILGLLENTGIIVAKVLDFKIDIQFVKGCSLWGLYRNFGNNTLGLTTAQMKHFIDACSLVDSKPKNVQYYIGHPDPVGDPGEEGMSEEVYHSGLHSCEQYPKIERDTLIEFDAIIYAPLTKFVKRNAIANHKKQYWKEDLLVDYTCKRLIEDIFRTKRDR